MADSCFAKRLRGELQTIGVPVLRANSWNIRLPSAATGPGLPVPMVRRSILTTLMISKRIADSAVPMSLLAEHPCVQFNLYRPAIKDIAIEMH